MIFFPEVRNFRYNDRTFYTYKGKNNAKSNNLSDYVPDAERPGLLRERMAAGRPGAGVSAQENAQGGVQFEHRK